MFHFFHAICKISNFNMRTAKHLAQASCAELTLQFEIRSIRGNTLSKGIILLTMNSKSGNGDLPDKNQFRKFFVLKSGVQIPTRNGQILFPFSFHFWILSSLWIQLLTWLPRIFCKQGFGLKFNLSWQNLLFFVLKSIEFKQIY